MYTHLCGVRCVMSPLPQLIRQYYFFFFNDTATTEIYTLSLHDALPICRSREGVGPEAPLKAPDKRREAPLKAPDKRREADRKSTRLNSSHSQISYAVFCLKKKKEKHIRGAHMKRH